MDVAALVTSAREFGAPHAYPGVDDLAGLLAGTDARSLSRVWRRDGGLVAWCVAQPAFGNVLFEVAPDYRHAALTGEVIETAVEMLGQHGADSADTPLESDDAWRADVLERQGFADLGTPVLHLTARSPARRATIALSQGTSLRSNADDVDAYVEAHRAAFGTSYLTRAIRETWADEDGYEPDLDLALCVDARVVAFAVCYLRGQTAEVGTVGVVPLHRGRGLAGLVLDEAMHRLVESGATEVSMSTSSANAPMLAVARSRGFDVVRQTSWLRRQLVAR